MKNKSLALNIAAISVGMLCMAYASVPLYNMFCRITGYGGTTQTAAEAPDAVLERQIMVRFNTDVAPGLPWQFKPEQDAVKVHVGENRLIYFSAQNSSAKPIIGVATYNVTPDKAGAYFNKVQCFCFDNQSIKPGEKVTFPVSFFIDPEIVNDTNMNDVNTITLSYTFFKAKT